MKKYKTLVLIPARGGSKRIPKKNIKKICGQPMIYWPLMELSKIFNSEQILISTDDNEIISKVEKKGINIPFVRPKELADDYTGTMEVVLHALKWFEKNYYNIDYVLIVYPTAVLLDKRDILNAIKAIEEDKLCDFIISLTDFGYPIQRAIFETPEGYIEMFQPDYYHTRSQDLIQGMHDAGQFYLFRSEAVKLGKNLSNPKVKPYKLLRNKVIDIDTLEDFDIAEQKMKILGMEKYHKKWKFK